MKTPLKQFRVYAPWDMVNVSAPDEAEAKRLALQQIQFEVEDADSTSLDAEEIQHQD